MISLALILCVLLSSSYAKQRIDGLSRSHYVSYQAMPKEGSPEMEVTLLACQLWELKPCALRTIIRTTE